MPKVTGHGRGGHGAVAHGLGLMLGKSWAVGTILSERRGPVYAE
jgi:hypothetical protein